MKRLSRFLMFAGIVTLTAIAVVWFRIDAIAQSSLEESLTKVLGVPTQVTSLSINKFAGSAKIKQLEINNPSGFSGEHIFEVQQINADFIPLSILGQTLKIKTLELDQIAVNFEQSLKNNNIIQIVKNVQSQDDRRSNNPANPLVSAQLSFKGKRFEIESVSLDEISVNVNFSPLGNLIPFGGLSQAFDVTIPNIDLKNVTSENAQFVLEGTLEDVVSDLVVDLAGGIFQEVPKQMESEDAKGIIGDLIKQLPI